MKVGLFVPCFVDQFFPEAARATVKILEDRGVEVDFRPSQTCCGQPAWNMGLRSEALALVDRFHQVFADCAYVVAPSASCVAMVRHHDSAPEGGSESAPRFSDRVFELCEFLWDVLQIRTWSGAFPHRVGLHQGCHGLRGLEQGHASERVHVFPSDPARTLLASMEGIELVSLTRPDECCGFGGTFSWSEPGVSTRMGEDRLADHERAGAQVLVSADSSCLLHLSGLARLGSNPISMMHVAEILAGDAPRSS